jgi:DNA-binding Lrp family transcriptional regulator
VTDRRDPSCTARTPHPACTANRHVSARLELRDLDLDCLNVIDSHGPLSPSALARRSGLHPATITGILDRLERGGWIARERDPSDRRGVLIRAPRERTADLMRLYSGMNVSMNKRLAGYETANRAARRLPPPHDERRQRRGQRTS